MKTCRHTILLTICTLTLIGAGLAACKKDWYDNSPNEALSLNRSSIMVGKVASGPEIFHVNARDEGWTMTGSAPDWITLSKTSGPQGIAQEVSLTITDYTPPATTGDEQAPNRTATLTFSSGGVTKSLVVTQLATELVMPGAEDTPDNRELFKYIEAWYYFSDEVAKTGSDPGQGYQSFFENYLKYLRTNAMDGKIWSIKTLDVNNRYLYSRIERYPKSEGIAPDAPPLTYGMDFDLRDGRQWGGGNDRNVARVMYVQKNSPAYFKQIERANWFDRINGQELAGWENKESGLKYYNIALDPLVSPSGAGVVAELGMRTLNYTTLANYAGVTVTLSPVRQRFSPVIYQQTFTAVNAETESEHRVGYLVLSAFDSYFDADIKSVFRSFRDYATAGGTGITDLILDLRYNRSGTVESTEMTANLIVPETARGKRFALYEFKGAGAGAQALNNKEVAFAPDGTDGIGVGNIYILTSKLTAGPSELLINALRGIEDVAGSEPGAQTGIKLIVIGDVTEGMSMGQVKLRYSGEKWDYDMWLLAFRCYNAMNNASYENGFTPNGGTIDEWSDVTKGMKFGWKLQEGAIQDPLMKQAVDYIMGYMAKPVSQVGVGTVTKNNPALPRKYSFPATMTMNVN